MGVLSTLTPKQYEIACMVKDGLTNKEIAAKLGISDQTVKNHLWDIFGRLGINNRTELAVMVMSASGSRPVRRLGTGELRKIKELND